MRREVLTWNDVDKLIDHLIPQFESEFDAMMMITRGGIIPGGMLAEALQLATILTAAVDFPAEMESEKQKEKARLLAWPKFIQFPENPILRGQRVLVIDDVWGSGRTITAVKNRISSAAGIPYTCVLHFNPYRSLFGTVRPDYYAAVTDAHIVYPWEINRGPEAVLLRDL
ncbi:MAG: phosphoribosyltransferase family protein [Anaerolineaceae bacterium]|jgi:hypoxanthine phosphoribosyltransferase|nr:phosphoribosyltransferase family protein [Anaerolineaceae bacterium]